MMDEKRKKLLELIEKLNFPILPEEAKDHVEKLSDEEVDLLISSFGKTKNYNDATDEFLRLNAPEEYKKIQEEYRRKLDDLSKEYEFHSEKTQEDTDIRMDAIDSDVERKLEKTVNEQEEALDKVDEFDKDLYKKVDSIIQK